MEEEESERKDSTTLAISQVVLASITGECLSNNSFLQVIDAASISSSFECFSFLHLTIFNLFSDIITFLFLGLVEDKNVAKSNLSGIESIKEEMEQGLLANSLVVNTRHEK